MDWKLPSNSGRQLSTWTVNDQTAEYLACDYEFRSHSVESEQPESAIKFSRLVLSRSKLLEFVEIAKEWLEKPLSETAAKKFEATVDMGGGFDTYLRLRFGESPSIISAQNNTVTINYCVAGVDGELAYVVDQSCLRDMTDGIATALGEDV